MDTPLYAPNINAFEYWTSVNGQDIKTIQAYSIGVHIQLVVYIFFSLVFVRNTLRSITIILVDIRRVASWCSMFSALSGVLLFGVMVIMHQLPYGPSCKTISLWSTIGMAISNFSINTALLERAYVVRRKNKKLLALGLFLNFIQLIAYFFILFVELQYVYRPSVGCYALYPKYGPYSRFLVDTPPSLIPSIRYKRDCWRKLARDGIITMMLIILSNLLSTILLILEVAGSFSMIIFMVDWVTTSTILIETTIKISKTRYLISSQGPLHNNHNGGDRSVFPMSSLVLSGETTTLNYTCLSR
ncbi:hypothetical protein BDF22DRAFT_701874 [Syncephalis plumigaleata]|nr:hypothetical protein BDF22DRAFT_701874 [Syncephalis plumigaleata]